MNIGQRIKERRKELNLSVDDVAKKLNKNRATVYRYESNEIENLPINILDPLAKALNTTPAYLMGWKSESTNVERGYSKNILSQEEATLLENYNKLDNEDRNKVVDYTKLLHNQDKYIVLDNSSDEISATIDNVTNVDFNSNNKEDDEEVFVPYKSLDEIDGCNAAHADDFTDEEKAYADKIILDYINKRELEKFNERKKNK